ncbi:hypothetical protein [Streptomyces synnematoformans]|uniref:Transposase n=1 Tax=Streptomyces synnematoformans TaxID=415721 RepID=A0ABN2XPI2_9ACTN
MSITVTVYSDVPVSRSVATSPVCWSLALGAKILTATEYRWLARRLTEALSDASGSPTRAGNASQARRRKRKRTTMSDPTNAGAPSRRTARGRFRFRENHVTTVPDTLALPTVTAECVTGEGHNCGANSGPYTPRTS